MTLDEAWAEAEAALPDGIQLWSVGQLAGKWHAMAMGSPIGPDEKCDHGEVHRAKRQMPSAFGPTPAAALIALAAELRAATERIGRA